MQVFAEIGICNDLQTIGLLGIQNKSIVFGHGKVFDQALNSSNMRQYWVLGQSRALVSGIRYARAQDIVAKVESPDFSMVEKAAIKFGGYSVESEDICHHLLCMSCCRVWRNSDLIDDVLQDFRLR